MTSQTTEQILLEQIISKEFEQDDRNFSRDEFFNIFATQLALKEYELSYDEIADGVVDGTLDGGIDAAYLFVNGELIKEDFEEYSRFKRDAKIEILIIQSKNTNGFGESAIQKLKSSLSILLRLDTDYASLGKKYNKKVIDFFQKFNDLYRAVIPRSPSLSIKIYYASKAADIHENVLIEKNLLISDIKQIHRTADFSFEFLDANELLKIHRKRPREDRSLKLAENPMSSTGKTLVALVNLYDFYKFIINENGLLNKYIFESNVRDYQGDTDVNSGISGSLKSDNSLDFWWLNNGVTIIAADLNFGGSKEIVLISPEIVNGLQTSNEIYNYFSSQSKESEPAVESRNILVKIVATDSSATRDKIIKATNSQNHIPKAVLKATDPIHRNIEDYLKQFGIFYDRRKNYYKNAGKKPSEIVSLPYLAQLLMSTIMGRPDTARARPSTLLEEESNIAYRTIFDPDAGVEHYKSSILISRKVDEFLKTKDLSPADKNNIKFYILHDLCVRLARSTNITPTKLKRIDISTINSAMLQESFATVLKIYSDLGGDDKVAKGTELLNRLAILHNRLFIQPELF